MQRHILNKRKASCTHISPRVTLQMLKKEFVKGEALRILGKNSPETTFDENNSNFKKTLDGERLPTKFERKGGITHREESLAFRDKITIEILVAIT